MRKQFDHILIPENGAELRTKLWWHCWQDSQLPLPAKGFLAGGAVASLILSEAWGGNFPINDLDVFLTDDNKIIPPATPVRTTEIALDENADDNGYNGWYKVRNSGYQVIKSDRFDLINTVAVRMIGNELSNFTAYRLILQGFDLNCCQVGIDLETDCLIWTPAFVEFLSTGQLKVTHLATPYHTVIRLAKKQNELKCYCDLPTELSLVASYVDMVPAIGYRNRNNAMYSHFFGKKYHDMYLSHKKLLEPYCHVFPGTNQLLLPGIGETEPGYYSMELKVPSFYRDLRKYLLKIGGLPVSGRAKMTHF